MIFRRVTHTEVCTQRLSLFDTCVFIEICIKWYIFLYSFKIQTIPRFIQKIKKHQLK